MRRILLLTPLLPLLLTAAPVQAGPVPGAAGCTTFPANNVWHADVSKLPVHARSAAWLASSSASTRDLHPDFGPSGGAMPYGIPYHVVDGSHAKVNVTFDYDDESDPGPYPLGDDTPIEGGAGSGGDMHTVVVDRSTCRLYETWYTQKTASGWTAGSGAIWDMDTNAQRPAGWTSADAAGLPILPGLLRLDEVRAGNVDHAIRFTVARTDRSYLWPARHHAGAANDPNLPPMGARFRLKASYPLTGLRADTQTVLRAMKKHGLMLADNGSNWYFQGTAEEGWPTDLLDELKDVPASAFEAVDESSLMISPDSQQAKGTAPVPRWTHWSPPSPTASAPRTPPATPAGAGPVGTDGARTPRRRTPAPAASATRRRADPNGIVKSPNGSMYSPRPEPTPPPGGATPVAEPPRPARGASRGWLWPAVALVAAGAAVSARATGSRRRRRAARTSAP